ncbi:nicotinate (nicotinamide) nucleotide adenylyltransferase [Curvibacter sp. CHRR-16]|nr:nicotinate (nicotinamide) nucleotide adenylyltransferase [Curvibacter sp. CHRR-16]
MPSWGILGGAFDPPHTGHVALAQTAVQALGLERLLVIPTGQAWHKTRPLSAGQHRLAMCQLAFASVPQAVVDDRELQRSGPSYTVDTLHELCTQHPGVQWKLIIGQDQAERLHTWHRWQDILQIATVFVAVRASGAGSAGQLALNTIPLAFAHHILPMARVDVSATAIRAAVQAAAPTATDSISALVGPAVAGYIAAHHLYQGLQAGISA